MIYPLIQQVVGGFLFPIPTTNLEIFWTLLGAQFGRSFGKKLDQGIQAGDWFKSLSPTWRGIIKRILDFTHHWQYGGILWLYSTEISLRLGNPAYSIPILFFGFGLMLDDIRDIDNLKRRFNNTPQT